MDEKKLEELFHDAASTAPPAAFDADDVVRGSRRVTARRRMAWAGGSLTVAAVLAGGLTLGSGAFEEPGGDVLSAPQPAEPDVRIGTEATPKSEGPGVLSEPGKRSCPGPDRALAEALVRQLPEAAGAPVGGEGCRAGVRSASFTLREAGASGKVAVILSPAGTPEPAGAVPGEVRHPDGTEQVTREARSGRLLTVLSDPDEGSAAPFAPRLVPVTEALAAGF